MAAASHQGRADAPGKDKATALEGDFYMEEEKKEKEAATDQKETDCPVLTVRTGNVLLHIGLHFNEKKEVSADDLFHRLVTERVLKDDF